MDLLSTTFYGGKSMKLNYKRTILVGFAFFLISAFWQAYDATIPVILTNKFGMSQTWSGVIMALDNILAVFMLPIFGALSDKCMTRYGKRTPFITIGTVIAAAAILCLSFVDNAQLQNIASVSTIDDPAALEIIYDTQAETKLLTPEGDTVILQEEFTKEEFTAIRCKITDPETGKTITNPDYTNYVAPARQAYAAERTSENTLPLVLFIALLLVVLVAMAIFRSPAVALMPDVTMKPLRSKANAVINLMGTAGGILVLVLGMVFSTSAVQNALMSYTVYYTVIAAIMLGDLKKALAERAIELRWDESVIDFLVKKSYSVTYGARNLRRTIQREIEDKIAETLIDAFETRITAIGLTADSDAVRLETM